ncbi:hypothetical protein RCC89_01590 [Cytophagaceae bacterium ABcell3]|nr:hypothetical protein RCC89_01590 [Cytophagaceae bacterium ABcell3]
MWYDKLGLRQHIGSSLGADIQLGRNESGFVTSMQASQQGMKIPWQAEITYNSLGQELDRVLGIGNVKNQFAYDLSGRPREQKTWNGTGARRLHRHMQYYWHPNDRLQRIHDVLTDTATRFRHDSFGNLIESLTVQEYRIRGKENYFSEGGALKNDLVNHFSDEPACRAATYSVKRKRKTGNTARAESCWKTKGTSTVTTRKAI